MKRLPQFAGLGFALVLIVGTLLSPGGASSNDAPMKIASYYAQHGRADIASDYASLAGTALLLVMFCAAAARMRGTARSLVLVAAGAAVIFELVATAIEMALAANVHDQAPPSTTAALFQVASRLFLFSTMWIGVAVAAMSRDETRTALRRFGALTAAVLCIAGLSVAYPHGPLAIVLLPGWFLLAVWAVWGSLAGQLRSASHAMHVQPAS